MCVFVGHNLIGFGMSNQGLFFNKDTLYRDQNVPLRLDAHTFENALSFFISNSCLQRWISIDEFCSKGIILIFANALCNMKKSLCFHEFLTQGLSDAILNQSLVMPIWCRGLISKITHHLFLFFAKYMAKKKIYSCRAAFKKWTLSL